MHSNISRMITDCCKKEGIEYKSSHLLFCDSARLGEIILELESFPDEISGICERHNINGNNKSLQEDMESIEKIEHHLRNLAQKIKKDEK